MYSTTSEEHFHAQGDSESVVATDAELEPTMQKMLGQIQASVRSAEQESAVRAILQGKPPHVVVLSTGGGKTFLVMVPACLLDSGVTIAMMPFRALPNDLSGRLGKAEIEHVE